MLSNQDSTNLKSVDVDLLIRARHMKRYFYQYLLASAREQIVAMSTRGRRTEDEILYAELEGLVDKVLENENAEVRCWFRPHKVVNQQLTGSNYQVLSEKNNHKLMEAWDVCSIKWSCVTSTLEVQPDGTFEENYTWNDAKSNYWIGLIIKAYMKPENQRFLAKQ